MNLGKTALYYKSNPKARAKKASYDRQFQKKKKPSLRTLNQFQKKKN